MNRSFLPALIVGTLTVGCAHQQNTKTASAPKPEEAPVKPVAETPPPPPAEPVADTASERNDDAIYFDFDSSLVRDDARPVLQKVGQALKSGNASLKIEGNCDEVGTVEYNLALGDARARAAKQYLVRLGVPATRITTASYGSQRPKFPGHDDDARAKNRRDDLVLR
jgi:peptidoglycan-associated lipoprotein